MTWSIAGERHVTVVVKATFALTADGPMRLCKARDVIARDRFDGAELVEPSELVPYLPAAERIYTGPDRISPADSEVIAEMVLVEDFEATLVWAIGLRARHQMAVGVLQDPLRLVADVATG